MRRENVAEGVRRLERLVGRGMGRAAEFERLVAGMARALPYDVETVRRVVELAVEVDLDDPEEFMRRCWANGLSPVATLSRYARRQAARHAGGVR